MIAHNPSIVYTVGYHTFGTNSAELLDTLQKLGVNVLLDVRSVPYSRKYYMYNKESLLAQSAKHNIDYIHVPELGAKVNPSWDVYSPAQEIWNSAGILPWESSHAFPVPAYNRPERTALNANDLIVDFEKLLKYPEYVEAISHFDAHFIQRDVICMMCAEAEPAECHRYFMHSRKLKETYGPNIKIKHIGRDSDGDLAFAFQDDVNEALVRIIQNKLRIFNPNDFSHEGEVLNACYRLNNLLHGWKK